MDQCSALLNTPHIVPDWPAAANVHAASSTRLGGVSIGDYLGLNLGEKSGDAWSAVLQNRRLVSARLPSVPLWLQQVHGNTVCYGPHVLAQRQIDESRGGEDDQQWRNAGQGDAIWTDQADQVLVIQTADCLPIFLSDAAGQWVAAIHGGWRSLAANIIAECLDAVPAEGDIHAWLGPAISQQHFEVGAEVRRAFVDLDPQLASAFIPVAQLSAGSNNEAAKYMADLYAIARHQLHSAGVASVTGGECCTFADPERFYSYRRQAQTGRLGHFIYRS